MPDKFEDLTTFLAVIDAGGVNAAPAELGIVKSAVSRRLSDLERRLGTSLIDHGTQRFEPTAVGIGLNASHPYDIAMPDDDTAVAAAVAGFGVARLPDFAVADLLASGSLVRLDDGRTGEPVAIVAKCIADASLEARRLVDALATAFG